MLSAIIQNTEAQRTRSFRPRTLSVISVPLCFKSSRRKDVGLDPRVSHSISRVRKTAVGDPRQHAKAGLCLAGGGEMSLLLRSHKVRRSGPLAIGRPQGE